MLRLYGADDVIVNAVMARLADLVMAVNDGENLSEAIIKRWAGLESWLVCRRH